MDRRNLTDRSIRTLPRSIPVAAAQRPRQDAAVIAPPTLHRLLPALLAALALPLAACDSCGKPGVAPPDAAPSALAPPTSAAPPVPSAAPDAGVAPAPTVARPKPRCPRDMVLVKDRYCVDRYEAVLVDAKSEQELSPYYPPVRKAATSMATLWEEQRFTMGDEEAQQMPLPLLPEWQRSRDFEPKAVSRKGATPQGYANGNVAAVACKAAGKRLCSLDEWRTACRGEEDRQFPYGDKYVDGRCNVFRDAHPAMVLHGNASLGHNDPRLNQVKSNGKPLLRKTGETATCYSRWGEDAVADMVGNLDEWVEDPKGAFAGGFYSRSKKDGCDSIVRAHGNDYWDYSTGVRCCADPPP